MDGLNIHGDLLETIARAERAGIDASMAATVKIAEAARDQMKRELDGGTSHVGGPPARGTGALSRSVKARVTYAEVSVFVHVGPTGEQEHVGRILNNGWQAHGPVRRPHSGRPYRYPFVPQVADQARAEVESIGNTEVSVYLREAGVGG